MESLLWLIYWVGVFLSLFPLTYYTAKLGGGDNPDGEDYAMGFFMAICSCWFWPLGLIGLPVILAVKHWSN